MSDQPEIEVSVSQWIADLREGQESVAQQELWKRYFNRLLGLARHKLGDAPRGAEDEEDVALSALGSFFRGVREGRFPDLEDREGLWPLLARITACKAINQRKRQLAAKRGGGKVAAASEAAPRGAEGDTMPLEWVDEAITPASLVEIGEQCRLLMGALPDPVLQQVAEKKLAGYTTVEIAEDLGVAPRTVERKLSLIRRYWTDFAEDGADSPETPP